MNKLNQRNRLSIAPLCPQQAGFTLVELAVVVFLIGILATMGISALNIQLSSAAISATKKKQDTIKDALIAYLGRNKRMPCPDTDVTAPDGIENRGATGTPAIPANTSQACSADFGVIPYQTLGLPKSAALDGWENYFSYQISNDSVTAPNLDWTLTNSFHTGNTGVITVRDRNSADLTNIVAAIISYGQDGLGAYTSKGTQNVLPDPTAQPDQYQNTQNTTPRTFYRREYTENASATGGAFDDILITLNRDDLLTPLIKDGSMKSPEAQWAEQLYNIKNSITAEILSSPTCSVTLSIPSIYQTDPWGGNVVLSPTTLFPFSSSSTSNLYSLSTSSPNPSAPTFNGGTQAFIAAPYPLLTVKCP